uniref:Uncharacterized protein n=1 Tax=Arundo donax TaxID=35708 RepID=A0A0A9GU70_ARUDO
MFVFHYGVRGAAIAHVISQYVVLLISLLHTVAFLLASWKAHYIQKYIILVFYLL